MRTTLSFIFFLSGVSALIFETLWFRLAGLSLGNSVWSVSLVLAAFMAGIAIGNAAIAKLGSRISRPIAVYAVLELAIGITGIAVVIGLPHFPAFLGPALGSLPDAPWLLNFVRLTIALGVLVIPATAMGATLPVLAKALSRCDQNFGATLGTLYGWNTLGAMLGVILSEAVLIKFLGVSGSGLAAMMLNLIAAVIAIRLSRSRKETQGPMPVERAATAQLSARCYRYLLVGFLSGAIMLALEVVWFRFLLLSHHGTSLIFAVMLAVVLAGIALGGLVAARLYRIDERSHIWLRHVTALSGAFLVLTYYGFDLFTVHQIKQETTILESVAFAAFLMFPVSLTSGVAFTMVGRAVKDELGTSVRTAGVATLCNTLGAMLGPLLGGFILLPFFGMELSFFILAASYGLTALVVPGEEPVPIKLVILSARAIVTFLLVCLLFFPFGLMERSYFVMVKSNLPGHTLIETREGLTETAFYFSHDQHGQPMYHRLMTNGFSMSATSVEGRRYMKLFVYLPLAFMHDARDALLISFGVGSTAKALTDTDGLRHIDIVDISRDILEMSSIVYTDDENPLHDERVRVHVEDGRFFLNAPGKQYDLITSEPPPPKMAGVVNLYSQQYFELIRRHLTQGGYATYWLPAHQLEPLDTLSIIRAFCNAFPDCSLWSGAGLDWILMGSNDAEPVTSIQQFSAQWTDPTVNQELIALGFETPAQLGSLFMADAGFLTDLTANVAPVTDNYPLRISSRQAYGQGRVPLYEKLMNETERLTRFGRSQFIDRFWPLGMKEDSEAFFRYERMIKNHFTAGLYRDRSDPFLWQAVDDVLTHTSLETLPLWLLGSDDDAQNVVENLLRSGKRGAEVELALAVRSLSERAYPAALEQIEAYMKGRNNVSTAVYNLYLYTLAQNGMLTDARTHIARLDTNERERADVQRFLNWFTTRFELSAREDSVPTNLPVPGNEPRRRAWTGQSGPDPSRTADIQ